MFPHVKRAEMSDFNWCHGPECHKNILLTECEVLKAQRF